MAQTYGFSFGNITFGIEEQVRTISFSYSAQNVELARVAGKPMLQRVGGVLDVYTISCWLRHGQIPASKTVRGYIDQLRIMIDGAAVNTLVWGNGEIEGSYTLESVSGSVEDLALDGSWLAANLNLTLKEVVK